MARASCMWRVPHGSLHLVRFAAIRDMAAGQARPDGLRKQSLRVADPLLGKVQGFLAATMPSQALPPPGS
jgi:hypothetical protein